MTWPYWLSQDQFSNYSQVVVNFKVIMNIWIRQLESSQPEIYFTEHHNQS